VACTTAIFIALAAVARLPMLSLNWAAAFVLVAALLILLIACGAALWRATRFS
jgi:hypothetical protein